MEHRSATPPQLASEERLQPAVLRLEERLKLGPRLVAHPLGRLSEVVRGVLAERVRRETEERERLRVPRGRIGVELFGDEHQDAIAPEPIEPRH